MSIVDYTPAQNLFYMSPVNDVIVFQSSTEEDEVVDNPACDCDVPGESFCTMDRYRECR